MGMIMGAGLAIAGALHSPEAHAEDTSQEMAALAERADANLEKEYQGYDFQTSAHSFNLANPKDPASDLGEAQVNWQYRQPGETMWHPGATLHIPRSEVMPGEKKATKRSAEAMDEEIVQEVGLALHDFEVDQAAQREIVESYHISGAAQELIVQMGGNPFSMLGNQNGQPTVELVITGKKGNTLLLDPTTDSADIHVVQQGSHKYLEVTLVSTVEGDEVLQVARWDDTGKLLGVHNGTSW